MSTGGNTGTVKWGLRTKYKTKTRLTSNCFWNFNLSTSVQRNNSSYFNGTERWNLYANLSKWVNLTEKTCVLNIYMPNPPKHGPCSVSLDMQNTNSIPSYPFPASHTARTLGTHSHKAAAPPVPKEFLSLCPWESQSGSSVDRKLAY